MLQHELGLRSNQKAELLRELTTLAAWIVRQAAEGRAILARDEESTHVLDLPVLDKIRDRGRAPGGLQLSDEEVKSLVEIMDRAFEPTPALKRALENLGSPNRQPPILAWSDTGR
ncbi:hypothetical protein KJ940_03110 [Myxococcota bacterium]|nr:hypothetical protein [Myxococcota bacterium]